MLNLAACTALDSQYCRMMFHTRGLPTFWGASLPSGISSLLRYVATVGCCGCCCCCLQYRQVTCRQPTKHACCLHTGPYTCPHLMLVGKKLPTFTTCSYALLANNETMFRGEKAIGSTPCQTAVLSFSWDIFLCKDAEGSNKRLDATLCAIQGTSSSQ